MILDPIATALRSSDFDMTVHGNAKKKKSRERARETGDNEQKTYRLIRWKNEQK